MPETRQNGTAIRTFREIRGMSRDELAQRVDLSYPYLANLELENKNAKPETVHRIAAALDVPVGAICRRIYAATPEAVSA